MQAWKFTADQILKNSLINLVKKMIHYHRYFTANIVASALDKTVKQEKVVDRAKVRPLR